MFKGLARLAGSEEGSAPLLRGFLLYCSAAVVALSLIGLLFSSRFEGLIKFLPLALAVPLVLYSVRHGLEHSTREWGGALLGLAVIAAYVLLGGMNAYVNAKIYDGPQYDGAFQLYFPLERMDQGEWPGKDFFYFHGQLIPVLVYPLFKLFGGDFFASQFSAKLIDLTIPLAYYLIFRWLGLDRQKSVLAIVLLVGILVTDRFTFGTQNPVDGIHIYALRSLIPFMFIAFYASRFSQEGYIDRFRRGFFKKYAFIQAGIFVASFYLGGEQALYLLAAMLLANVLTAGFSPFRITMQSIWLVVLAFGLLLMANVLLFGSQKPLSYLGEISKNQTWFYSSYPNEFLHGALDFSRYRSSAFKVSAKLIVCCAGLPLLVWLTWWLREQTDKRLFHFALIGSAYGLIGLTSLVASYAGEQYTDNAIKVMLITLVVLLIQISFRLGMLARQADCSANRTLSDLIAASPLLLAVVLAASVYAIWLALKPLVNLKLLRALDTPIFMEHPDLRVKLPYYPLSLKPDMRFHASQFIALDQAAGNASARILYPEFSFVNGFEEGVKNLYMLKVRQGNIPNQLHVGDFCSFGSFVLPIADIDRNAGEISFAEETRLDIRQRFLDINCYRSGAEAYLGFHGKVLHLEHNIFDRYFYDGLFRGTQLQVRLKTDVDFRPRPEDALLINGQRYRIQEVHPNGVLILDSSAHPLPFAFDRGATFTVIYQVEASNSFSLGLQVSPLEKRVTRVLLNDRQLLAEVQGQHQLFLAKTNQVADVQGVDLGRATIDLAGSLSKYDLSYGLHFGSFDRARYNIIAETPPVFQLMKGILSAKHAGEQISSSNIDFLFHTFSTRLMSEYLDGIRVASPQFVSMPSGRYVNNFIWYDNWLLRARWPVFEYILTHYRPAAWSKFELFWEEAEHHLLDGPWVGAVITRNDSDGDKAVLFTEGPQIGGGICQPSAYEVEVDYSISGWQRALPLIGSSTRHVAFIDDALGVPLAFNPNEHTVRFPVFPSHGETKIQIGSVSPFGFETSITIDAIRYRKIELPPERIAAMAGRAASGSCL